MWKTPRSSVVKATTPTIASYLFILACILWINSTVCCAASQEPVHSSQNTFTVIGTDWGSSSRHARRRAEEASRAHRNKIFDEHLPFQFLWEDDPRPRSAHGQWMRILKQLP